MRYLIPDGYIGWVVIEPMPSDRRSLLMEDDFIVMAIPSSGRLTIPGRLDEGGARDEFYYVDSDGRRRLLPDGSSGSESRIWGDGVASYEKAGRTLIRAECFFVGTENDFKAAMPLEKILESYISSNGPVF